MSTSIPAKYYLSKNLTVILYLKNLKKHLMYKTEMEQQKSLTNVDEFIQKPFSNDAVEYNKLYGNTPIWIRHHNGKWYATLSKFQITDRFDTEEELIDKLDHPDIRLICDITSIMTETAYQMHKYDDKPDTEKTVG